MDIVAINEPEVLIRYGRLSAHARDRVLDQFYLVYHDGASFGLYLVNKTITVMCGFLAIGIPLFALLTWIAHLTKLSSGDMWFLIYGAVAIYQLVFFGVVFAQRTKTKYRQTPFQTTEIGLTRNGMYLHTRHIHGGLVKTVMLWEDVSSVRLIEHHDDKGDSFEIRTTKNQIVTLFFDCIQTIEERQILRQFLLRYIPQVDTAQVTSGLLRVGKSDDIPFTKLWSQALYDARPRVHTECLEPGDLLQTGRYLVEARIGSGGQGAVYRATMREVDGPSEVVLKEYVLPDLAHEAEHKAAVEQFEREVRLLAKLSHPGITKMLNAFVEDHRAYLVLENCQGVSLRDYVVSHGAMDSRRVTVLAHQLCDILQFLHSMSPAIMHLDFSPENILVSPSDHLTVIDFNISAEENSIRTRTVMGKQKYMSPEQYRGKPTPRSDIYSLGATLFFLLTETEPQPISVSRVSKLIPSVDAELDAVIAKATALEESDRVQSAQLMKQALSTIQERIAESSSTPRAGVH
jgi:tRNA A-37 threonylcarbamoyl transferase component Bud32